MKNYNELQPLVIVWATEKGIFEKSTPLAQAKKTEEEVNELLDAVTAQNAGLEEFVNAKGKTVNTKEEIKDSIGDVIVTLINQAHMQNLDLMDCLESAYNIISKRKGKMIDGFFVKDSD